MFAARPLLQLLMLLAALLAGGAAAQQVRNESLAGSADGWTRTWVDADNDGRDEFCYLWGPKNRNLACFFNREEGMVARNYLDLWDGNAAEEGGSVRWSDVNGDGFIDICRAVIWPSPRLICRFGPDFQPNSGFELPWTLQRYTGGQCTESGCEPTTHLPGVNGRDFYLADVGADGIADICYLFFTTQVDADLRCRIGVVGSGRTSMTFQAETPAWTVANIAQVAAEWPVGFHDFNGDGRADYCRVLPGGTLRCAIFGPSGFSHEVSTAAAVRVQWKEGAAFVDVNGDGKTDFCRLDGMTGAYYIRCTLSNGLGWEFGTGTNGNARERISPTFSDPGNQYSRWWVDVNADGLPDFCRLAVAPDPMQNDTGHLLCRLSRGDGTTVSSMIAFGYSDVRIDSLYIGRGDGGRAFCDAFGTGIPTFCRATYRAQPAGQVCYEHGMDQTRYCYESYSDTHGYYAGYSDTEVQAQQPLLTSYSDGVGAETRITYAPLTSPQVYSRSNTMSNTDARLLLMQPRSPVVFETRAWTTDATPVTLTGNARYLYKDLWIDTWSGSRGFRDRWIFQEGSNTLDHVVYFQGLGGSGSVMNDLREVGLVQCQEKFAVQNGLIPEPANVPADISRRAVKLSSIRAALQTAPTGGPCSLRDQNPTTESPFVLLQATTNTLGTTAPFNPRFRFIAASTARSWDWTGSSRIPLPTADTATSLDDVGNVLQLVQSTRDGANREWRKTTLNEYAADSRLGWLLGRLTRSTVQSLAPTAAVQLAVNDRSFGNEQNANVMSPPTPPPLSPAVLAAILQLLLDD